MKNVLFFIVGLAGIALFLFLTLGFLWTGESADKESDYESGYIAGYTYIKSISELQEQVGAEPDGKICEMWNVPGHSETGEKWNRAYCDQEAVKMFRRMSTKE